MSIELAPTISGAPVRRWKRYPAYRDSGVEWLEEVPEGWVTWKITHGFQQVGSGTTPKSDDMQYYNGEIPWVTTSELRETVIIDTKSKLTEKALKDYSSLHIYPPETLLFAMYGATIGRLGFLKIHATVNQACCAFTDSKFLDPKFTFYWLWMHRPILITLSVGGGQPNLSQDDLRNIRIPAPPIPEQRTIAAFLDRETGRIDTLIEKKERQIELLQEKRAALISHTVTKGLDPDVTMKDSGVEWLGEVPEGWVTWKITHGFQQVGSGTTPKSDDMQYYNGKIPWVTTSELRETVITNTKSKLTEKALKDYSSLHIYPPDTLLFAMYGATIGRMGLLEIHATVNQACCAFTDSKFLDPKFTFYWLWMRRPVLITLSVGGGQPNLSQDDLRNIRIPAPPIPEQRAIATFLDRETGRIDTLTTKIRESTFKLREYRTALISAAVTGKIDVREDLVT